jgi:hypothetical protein
LHAKALSRKVLLKKTQKEKNLAALRLCEIKKVKNKLKKLCCFATMQKITL